MLGLEQTLGVRLLNRTTRTVSLTEAGAHLLGGVRPVFHALDTVLDTLAEARGAPAGTLRLNANKSAARLLLREVVPRFLSRYPNVDLDLVSDGRLVDIVESGFDAGFRLAEDVPQDMVAVRFGGDVRFVAVASPTYLAERIAPRRRMTFAYIAASVIGCPAESATGGSSASRARRSPSTCPAC